MFEKCESCCQDKGPVIQGLALDMADVIENHEIKDSFDESMFNGLSEVKDIGFAVNDVFDAIMLERHLSAFSTKNDPSDEDKVE